MGKFMGKNIDDWIMECDKFRKENQTLKQAIIELKKSNDFYGDKYNFQIESSTSSWWIEEGDSYDEMGKLARQVNQNQVVQKAYKICKVENNE